MTEKGNDLTARLAVASKQMKADTLIINGKLIDVFTLTIKEDAIAIVDGVIVGIGDYTDAVEIIDAKGRYICPALIDGHVHIESAMVTPEALAEILVPRGVTTIMADPHELANVGGVPAVEYMVQAARDLPLNVKMMVPSSVPAASFEENGATVTAGDVAALFATDGVYGLGEVMDYPAVLNGDPQMLAKLQAAKEHGAPIDGHAAGLPEEALNAYVTAGIYRDHEAVTKEEAEARISLGMYVLMREGTAARDVEALLPAVTPANARRFAFATDDKHLDDLIEEGSIDFNVKKAISLGMEPLQAIQIATLNTAECFNLQEKGAIAPGKEASFLFLSDLDSFSVEEVYVRGQRVAEQGRLVQPIRDRQPVPSPLLNSVHVAPFSLADLALPLQGTGQAHVICAYPGSIVTEKRVATVPMTLDGQFCPDGTYVKLVVAERHRATGNIGVGILQGITFTSGALVSTVAHDSHNIIACGTDDESIYHAMQHVMEIGGGMAVVQGDKILASLPLKLGGLMSTESVGVVKEQLNTLQAALKQIGYEAEKDPFLTLAFLALPVIPSLKLTSRGLFDVEKFAFIDVAVSE
ncbi:adenine deaminase [Bacillus sp. FSL W7-1360]